MNNEERSSGSFKANIKRVLASVISSWRRLTTGAKATIITCTVVFVLIVTAVIISLSGDNSGMPGGVTPPNGEVDKEVALITAFFADTNEIFTTTADLGVDGAANLVLVYNRAPAGAYFKITEIIDASDDDDIEPKVVTVKGKMGGFSSKHGGYLVAYSVDLGYSSDASKFYTVEPYYTDSKGNTAVVGDSFTFTQPGTFVGVGNESGINEYSTVMVDSGKQTIVSIFLGGHCKDPVVTLSTKRTGVSTVQLVPVSNEYNEDLKCYEIVVEIPALVWDDADDGINRYTLTVLPDRTSKVSDSYRVQIRDPDSNIDEGGWRPLN